MAHRVICQLRTPKKPGMKVLQTRGETPQVPRVLAVPGDSPWLSQPATPCPLPGYTPRRSRCLASGIKGPWGSLQLWGAAWDHPAAPRLAGGRVCPVPGGCGGRCLVAPAIINPRGPGSPGCHSLTGSGLKSYQSCGVPYTTGGAEKWGCWCCPFPRAGRRSWGLYGHRLGCGGWSRGALWGSWGTGR